MSSVSPSPYRQVLALPGVTRLLLFAVLARVPITAAGVVLTLHVVTALHGGYAAAGLVATASTVADAVGGPWRGRAVDRSGLRRALLPSVVVATAAWALAPFASYRQLLVLAVAGGLLGLPVFTVVRQSLSVLVPVGQQRTAFSLDGVGTEASFMIGPAVGVLLCTQASTRVALCALAGATLVVGLGLLAMNPPTRTAVTTGFGRHPAPVGASAPTPAQAPGAPVPGRPGVAALARREWFTPSLVAVLAVAAGATVVLAGTDVALVAHLREHGAIGLTGLVFVAWGASSMAGGLVYGSLHRQVSPFVLLLALALLTVPVGAAPGPALLLVTILPAAAVCAPVIAATAEGVSRAVTEGARGEAMGWHGAALRVGSAIGAPLAGVFMDAQGAWSGFVAVGGAGAMIAGSGLLVVHRRRRQPLLVASSSRPDAPSAAIGAGRQGGDGLP
ncbi:MAG TPA: MFS transporter [Kineosporiaceae bacterium]